MTNPITLRHMGFLETDPCGSSSTTVTGVTITPTEGTCFPGGGLTYSVGFTLSGALGANETLELWVEIYEDAEGAPGLTYDSGIGRFSSSPIAPPTGWDRPAFGSDGAGSPDVTFHRTAEIRVVPTSTAAGSGTTCDSAQDTDSTTSTPCQI